MSTNKRVIRSCDLVAMAYKIDDRRARMLIQRNPPDSLWGAGATHSEYYITTRLRMTRCLWLQSAFLAQGGKVLQ